ncbi:MAG: sulfatase-like hydrolase/transferase, partial [Kiritimatiellia bacterium]
MTKRPNILIMIPHDLGDYLNCYGHSSVKSPNLNRMAAEGVRFTNVFTTSPECTPSRGGFYSGYQPHQNGLMGLANFGWEYNQETPHIAKRLRDSGYETYLFGFQHESHGTDEHVGATLGYKHVRRAGNYSVETVCANLNDFIENEAPNSKGPWFACAGFHHTHRNWPKNRDFDPATVEIPAYLPDTPVVREDMAQFHQSI